MSQNPIYLTLDRRNNRIRITNEMLARIGMPKYLQLLISTEDKMMLVRAIEKGTAKEQAYKVKYQPSNESYKEGEWHFDFDKAITEINVGNKTKKNV